MSIETLRPNATGDYTGIWGQEPSSDAHWDKVDEAEADDATTYIWTDETVQEKDAYNLGSTAIPSGSTINSVKVYFRCMTENPTYGKAQPFLRLGSDETAGTLISLTGSWATYNETLARPGGGTWGVDDLNSLQACIGLQCKSGETWSMCTQVYAEVDYTATTSTPKTSSDAGSGVEGTPMQATAVADSELGQGSDSLIVKIETPTKGGGTKLWT